MDDQDHSLFGKLLRSEPIPAKLPRRKLDHEMAPADWRDRVRKTNALNIFLASQIKKYKERIAVLERKIRALSRSTAPLSEEDCPDITDLEQDPPDDIARDIDEGLRGDE